MRFKQYLKEAVSNKEMNEWFRQYDVEAYDTSNLLVSSYHYIYDKGEISPSIAEVNISVDSGDVTWKPPLTSDEWGNIISFSFSKNVGRHTINAFSDLPNVKNLSFNDCTIKSLSGAEKLTEVQYIEIRAWCEIQGGLLRLLKMPNLREIDMRNYLGDQPLEKALDIVKKHVEDGEHDIIACQTELMDADLEEYAKL